MRLNILKITIAVLFVFLVIGLFNVQIINGSYFRALGESNRIRLLPMEAPRGRIFDRVGSVIAGNRPSFTVSVVPEDFDEESLAKLSKLLNISPDELRARVDRGKKNALGPVAVCRDVDRVVIFRLEERNPELNGVAIQLEGVRYYPYKEVISHVAGYIGKISLDEYKHQSDVCYSFNDYIGRAGVEAAYDRVLRGENGGKQLEVDARGHVMRTLSERQPVAGCDLALTLDAKLQEAVWDKMKDVKRGTCAMLDLKTGGILAFVSKPAYDPNIFVTPDETGERLRLLGDKSSPMLDRNISAAFPPGSVFKLVTATAALETQKASPFTTFTCTGSYRINPRSRAFKCWNEGGHGRLNMYEGIERSCNIYFYKLGKRVGVEDIAEYARKFGLGKTSSLRLPNIEEGLVPDRQWKQERFKDRWYQGETLNYAIGQGFISATPLQILQIVGVIANEGKLKAPHIVEGEKVETIEVDLKPKTYEVLKQSMRRVVQSKNGTGHFARVPFLQMGAKTGTAQAPPGKPHAWFAGFFPYDDPQVALVVFIEHGGPGGVVAARLAKKIVTAWKDVNDS